MAYQDFHVSGPAIVSIAFFGESYSDLGITVDGVGLGNEGAFEDVVSDDSGPIVPADVQYFGEQSRLRCEFIRWDETIFRKLESRIWTSAALAKTVGAVRTVDIGTLMKAGKHTAGVHIASSARTGLTAEQPWTYPCCYAENVIDFKVGTRVTRKVVTLRAIPSDAGILYLRS